MSTKDTLEEIVIVRQRMFDRCLKLDRESIPGRELISGNDLDVAELDLLQAKLELARCLEEKE